MRKIGFMLAATLVLAGPLAAWADPPPILVGAQVVAIAQVKAHSGPGSIFPILRILPNKQRASVIACAGADWCQLQTLDHQTVLGWVTTAYLVPVAPPRIPARPRVNP